VFRQTSATGNTCSSRASATGVRVWHPGGVQRQKHSDKRLDELLDEETEQEEPRGILELFPRDEDAPLAREPGDEDPE
jgi:hypothetical protein